MTKDEAFKEYEKTQAAYEKAQIDFVCARKIMPERLACVKARTIRNQAWDAYIKAGG